MVRSPLDEAIITHRLRELRQDRYFRGGDSGNAMKAETSPAGEPYGALAPRMLGRAVIAMTAHMPANWLGRLLANGLRRIVMQRLPEDGGVDVKRWGLRLRLHPRRNGGETGLLFTPQFYEAGERAALAAWIAEAHTPGQPFVFVDIGANVGLFSFFVASCAGAEARILAIEPKSENLRRMRFNIEANADLPIQVLPSALGEPAGTVEPEVECKPLAQALAQSGVMRIDALRISVGGSEDRILLPFFKGEPVSLWPRFIILKDGRKTWRADLFTELRARDYKTVGTTRYNVVMKLMTQIS